MKDVKRKKIKTMEVMIAEVIKETHDTSTIILFTGNDKLDYESGHFLTIDPHQFEALERWTSYLENAKGAKEPARAYSLASAPDEHQLAITVKEERYIPGTTKYPPLLSPILAKRSIPGRKMIITGFTGPYTLPIEKKLPDEILHICAGSGIVPNWGIMKFCLRNYPDTKHTLIYSNKTWEETIYGEKLVALKQKFPGQLDIIFTLTRENPKPIDTVEIRKGRIDTNLLSDVLSELNDPMIYVCGPANSKWDKKRAKAENTTLPPRFMESTLNNLKAIGVDKSRIKRESYG